MRTYGRTDSPCSTGLRPLRGRCPKSGALQIDKENKNINRSKNRGKNQNIPASNLKQQSRQVNKYDRQNQNMFKQVTERVKSLGITIHIVLRGNDATKIKAENQKKAKRKKLEFSCYLQVSMMLRRPE